MIKTKGFTMIELMIVVAIIAILAAIAIPSYRSYVIRANRTEAVGALTDLAARQERYYYSNNAYTDDLANLNGTAGMGTHYYVFSIVASAGTVASPTYAITATPIGTQLRDDAECQSMSVNNVGVRHSTGSTPDNPKCWGNQ